MRKCSTLLHRSYQTNGDDGYGLVRWHCIVHTVIYYEHVDVDDWLQVAVTGPVGLLAGSGTGLHAEV